MMSVELMLLIPIVSAVLCWVCPREKLISWINIILAIISTSIVLHTCVPVFIDYTVTDYGLWYIDGLSALFIIITSVVALSVALYSHGYMGFEREELILKMKQEKNFYVLINLFVAVMLTLFTVSSLGILWILIEATTLVTTFLVGFYHNEHSTEAAWKYLIICSVGITLALVGISMVYASTVGVVKDESTALNWDVLVSVAANLDPVLMKTAMALIIIGFGTKVGFAPMHTWLPDAHSQAPTPVSALLSATLLNCALYSILRFYIVSEITIPGFAQNLILIFGILSLIIAAAFIMISKDIKRMLAYSSIENMGIIAIGFGIGTEMSIFAALFMVMAHSFTKPILFFSAGNIMQQYGTKDMAAIKGLREKMPFTAFMLSIGSFAILGMPVFASFVGELMLMMSALDSGLWWITAILIVLLLAIFAGFMMRVIPMVGGHTDKDVKDPKGITRTLSFLMLTGLIAIFGLFMPDSIYGGFDYVVSSIFGGLL